MAYYWMALYMMAIGMGEITEKNHLEVYARLRMLTLRYYALATMEMESLG
jgi:hypothetical protein